MEAGMKTTKTSEPRKRQMEERRQELVAELGTLAPFCRGSLHPFSVKRNGKEWRYYSWEVGSGAKRRNRTLRIEEVERIQQGIARRKAYEEWRTRYEETMEEAFLAGAAVEAEKKRARTRSVASKSSAAGRHSKPGAGNTSGS